MTVFRHVLLVEDDPRDIELTLNELKKHHFVNQIDVVRDGQEALDYLHRRGKFAGLPERHPAVVLLDIKMPKMDGIELLRHMKSNAQLKTIPVVILTSSKENADTQTCYQLGVNAYVVKPVDFAQFAAAVREIGVFWVLVNEPPPVQ